MNNDVVHSYNPEWRIHFEEIKAYLKSGLGENCLAIEHIGSTSIPGMTAKPIIDVDIVIQPGTFDEAKSALEGLGYLHEGDKGLKGREAFDCNNLDKTLKYHHMYVCEEGSYHLNRHLSFRNFLMKNTDTVRLISKIKVQLAQDSKQNRKEYQRRKEQSTILKEIVEKAFKSEGF